MREIADKNARVNVTHRFQMFLFKLLVASATNPQIDPSYSNGAKLFTIVIDTQPE
jgi:hypothetical protein